MFVDNPHGLSQEAIDELKRVTALCSEPIRTRYQQMVDAGLPHDDLVGFIGDGGSDGGIPMLAVNVLRKSQVSMPVKVITGDPEYDDAAERVLNAALVSKEPPMLHVAVMTSKVMGVAVMLVGVPVSKGGEA